MAREHLLAPVAPVYHVIDRAGELHSELAGHERDSAGAAHASQYYVTID
jgi:hypothetical protein